MTTSLLVAAWTLRADAAVASLASFAAFAHASQLAEILARARDDRRRLADDDRTPRDAPIYLVIDTVVLVLATMRALVVTGGAAFADPAWAAATTAAWPLAMASWTSRLSTETDAFADVAAAVGRKESMALQRSTSVRRLGGARCPPPDAGRVARALYTASLWMDGARAMAESGSGRFFRRAQLLCSLADWTLLLSAWQAAVSGATPPAVIALPLAAFFALDLTRLAAQLWHSRLLTDARARKTSARGARRAAMATKTLGRRLLGRSLPAGMTTRLTQSLYTLNVFNASLAAVLFLFFGSNGNVPYAVAAVAASTRLTRLLPECAYLVASLSARVDRTRFPHAPAVTSLASTAADLADLSSAVASKLDAAGRRMDELIAGFGASGALASVEGTPFGKALASARGMMPFGGNWGGGGEGDGEGEASGDWSSAGMSLPEFTEAISTGLRGHLVGERAEAAAEKLFREMARDADAPSIGLADIQRWLADQPPLAANANAEESKDAGEAATKPANATLEKEMVWRRSVQRVLQRFVRRAEYGRSQALKAAGAGGASDAAARELLTGLSVPLAPGASMMPLTSDASEPPKRGLRLLSLEGGGIKGLALIWQLRALERAAGRPIHELFDLIGGVSTGGIIALGLSRGVSLSALEAMYHEIGRNVFGKQSALRQLIRGNAADNTAIHDLLVANLGDAPMLDAPDQLVRCFVVSTQQTERLEVRLIRTYKHPNKGRDQNEGWSQWEAGMATSSAPTVFPPFVRTRPGDGAKQVFIDGALSGYNNPSSLLLNEGLDLAEPGQQVDVLLSLGCGEASAATGGADGDRGLVFWLGQVVNLAFDVELQEAHVASLIQRFSPQTMHVRLNPPTGDVSLTESRPDVLARMEDDTRQYLAENRMIFAEVAAALTAHIPHVGNAPSTPWDHPGLDRRGDDDGADDADESRRERRERVSSTTAKTPIATISKKPVVAVGGASATVRRGPRKPRPSLAGRASRIYPDAPVASLDRFPKFPGPGTAKSAAAAKERAERAKEAAAAAAAKEKGARKGIGTWGFLSGKDKRGAEVESEAQSESRGGGGGGGDAAQSTSPSKTAERERVDAFASTAAAAATAAAATTMAVDGNIAAAATAATEAPESTAPESEPASSWFDEKTEVMATWEDETEAEAVGEEKNEDTAEETPDAAKEKHAEKKNPR